MFKKLRQKPYNKNSIEEDKIFISNKLGITKEKLNEYFNMPLKVLEIINQDIFPITLELGYTNILEKSYH